MVKVWGKYVVEHQEPRFEGLASALQDLILRVEGELDSVATGPHGDPAQAVLNMLLLTRERGVRSVEVGNGEGGVVKVEFEPTND